MDGAATMPESWQEALTRRLRALLRAAPLERLEASKGRRDLDLGEQDLRALALRALDLVIERMGLGSGPTVEELVDELAPLVRSCAADPEVDADAVARMVIDELLNERDRRRAFRESYLALEGTGATRRQLDFHILQEHATADGNIALRATTEAINFYAGMLDYPVEDAQIAEEAILQAQVRRGRISDAVQTAKRARLRSIEYEQKILRFLETTRRDVAQIDWVRDVLGLLEAARQHIHDRIRAEGDLLRAIEERLERAAGDGGAQLASLLDVLDECRARHLRLEERLISANQDYLREHDRQAFRPRALAPLPDLEAEVLQPVLGLPAGALARRTEWLLARLQPPRTPPVLHLASLTERLLAPRRADEDEPVGSAEVELEAIAPPPPRFGDEERQLVSEILASLSEARTLSTLLREARNRGASPAAERLLVAKSLLAFDPAAKTTFRAERLGCELHDESFFGEDLLLERDHAEGET